MGRGGRAARASEERWPRAWAPLDPGGDGHSSPFKRVQLAVNPMLLVKMTWNNKRPISGEKNTSSHSGFT